MWLPITAVLGAVAVACGAFGAHALKSRLSPELLGSWNTAVLYHLVHAVVLLSVVLYCQQQGRSPNLPAALLTAGIVLFSGSIYVLVLTQFTWLGPVTPIGGFLLIAGWLSLWTLR
ncbi:MAG: DUF423 domain-containing protein [Deltaproteobacteria bacterium]|nr:DUF423 domain-containing protein [Deltaproteobacteria bacterium]